MQTQTPDNIVVFDQFIKTMKEQGMSKQAQDYEETLQQVKEMKATIDTMAVELHDVKQMLLNMQKNQPNIVIVKDNNNLINDVSKIQQKNLGLSEKLSLGESHFFKTAKQAMETFKEKGKEGLANVLQKGIKVIQSILKSSREGMEDILADYKKTENQIDSIGNELKQAGRSIANAGRIIVGKEAMEVSKEKKE